MAEINFPDLLNQLKTGLLGLAQTSLQEYAADAKNDAQNLLNTLEADLQKWTNQLSKGDITPADFEFLLEEKKDLIEMAALKQVGLAQIRIDEFKAGAFKLIATIIKGVVKV